MLQKRLQKCKRHQLTAWELYIKIETFFDQPLKLFLINGYRERDTSRIQAKLITMMPHRGEAELRTTCDTKMTRSRSCASQTLAKTQQKAAV